MRYNVARNPIGTVHNAPLASALGKELQPPILSTLEIHWGRIKREIDTKAMLFVREFNVECQI